jgi:hypothetical protein
VTRHEVEGRLPLRVSMPDAYVGNPQITYDWWPIHLTLNDEGAVRSFAEGLFKLLELADKAYPNLDAALREQRLARQASLRREGQEDRRVLNGGGTILERAMEAAHVDAQMKGITE